MEELKRDNESSGVGCMLKEYKVSVNNSDTKLEEDQRKRQLL